MTRIVIQGCAAVFRDDEQITDPKVLRSLDGLVYDEERFTDYLGGSPEENAVVEALEPGGILKFGFREGDELLTVATEYRSRRPLSNNELRLLVDYTMGQWSDGIGENWTGFSAAKCGCTVMCLTTGDNVGSRYPLVTSVEE